MFSIKSPFLSIMKIAGKEGPDTPNQLVSDRSPHEKLPAGGQPLITRMSLYWNTGMILNRLNLKTSGV
jgi:hypothetical protein